MASQVAPGYNPEVSLLQGGTAPITPVQGGGGMEAGAQVPPGYNINESLLNTGAATQSVQILGVRGGGLEGGAKTPYGDYTLEVYKPKVNGKPSASLRPINWRLAAKQGYENSSKAYPLNLRTFASDPVPNDSLTPDTTICPTSILGKSKIPATFFQGVRRHIVTLDIPEVSIWIVNNLKGNIFMFEYTMNLLTKSQKPKAFSPTDVIVFTGSFFSGKALEDALLFDLFLQWKMVNFYHFFFLVEHSEEFFNATCGIMTKFLTAKEFTGRRPIRKLTTFYEPDIVIFKRQKIVLRNGALPVKRGEGETIKVSAMLKRYSDKYKDILIQPSPSSSETDVLPNASGKAPDEEKYFQFDFHAETTDTFKFPTESSVKCPEDKDCFGFEGGYKLEDLTDNQKLEASGIYHIYVNKDGTPFLKQSKEAPKETPIEAPKEDPKEAPEEAPEEALEETLEETPKAKSDEAIVVRIPEGIFTASEEAEEAPSRPVELNSMLFTMRFASSRKITDNWKNQVFTQGEADFLNQLQLTPKLLQQTFGEKGWADRLAEFLEKIVMSNCFQDTTLLTNRECGNAQQFVKQIYLRMFTNLLESMYDSTGMPKPETFLEAIRKLKELLAAIRALGVEPVEAEFTGDLLNRFYRMYYDPETETFTGEAAMLSDKARKTLEALKFYRVQNSNYEELTKELLKYMKPKGLFDSPYKGPSASPPAKSSEVPTASKEELYSVSDFEEFTPSYDLFQDPIFTEGDGLCFYRAVLKGLQNPPISNRTSYTPTMAETMSFVKDIKKWLESNRTTLQVKGKSVEQYFNNQYGPKKGIPDRIVPKDVRLSNAEMVGYIPIQGNGVKMTFQEYLNRIVNDPIDQKPYAEVEDAGIGQAAAEIKNVIIITYARNDIDKTFFKTTPIFIPESFKTKQFPLSKVIFLELEGGNHFNLLKLKPETKWPHKTAGGGDVIDLGVFHEAPTRKKRREKGARTQTRKHK